MTDKLYIAEDTAWFINYDFNLSEQSHAAKIKNHIKNSPFRFLPIFLNLNQGPQYEQIINGWYYKPIKEQTDFDWAFILSNHSVIQ